MQMDIFVEFALIV